MTLHSLSLSVINCGIPKRSTGVRYVGNSFTINSEVIFECEPGYKLVEGKGRRVCQENGKWSGSDITCRCEYNAMATARKETDTHHFIVLFSFSVVECGRVQPILKGEIIYVNSTTYLSSEINYSCGTGYKLVGNKARHCQDDGRWSGIKPKCEGKVLTRNKEERTTAILLLFLLRRNSLSAAGDSKELLGGVQWQ